MKGNFTLSRCKKSFKYFDDLKRYSYCYNYNYGWSIFGEHKLFVYCFVYFRIYIAITYP